MTTDAAVGTCPECGRSIPPGWVLIEYDRGDDTGTFAECPSCASIVRPA